MQQQQSADNPNVTNELELRVGRLQRQKVCVPRSGLLDSAAKVMEMYSNQKTVPEVEYFGEVGTGLGPTLEFYTLLSHELQKSALGMWSTTSSPTVSTIDSEVERSSGAIESSSYLDKINKECTSGNADFVQAPLGLFPHPWPPNIDSSISIQFSKVLDNFHLLG